MEEKLNALMCTQMRRKMERERILQERPEMRLEMERLKMHKKHLLLGEPDTSVLSPARILAHGSVTSARGHTLAALNQAEQLQLHHEPPSSLCDPSSVMNPEHHPTGWRQGESKVAHQLRVLPSVLDVDPERSQRVQAPLRTHHNSLTVLQGSSYLNPQTTVLPSRSASGGLWVADAPPTECEPTHIRQVPVVTSQQEQELHGVLARSRYQAPTTIPAIQHLHRATALDRERQNVYVRNVSISSNDTASHANGPFPSVGYHPATNSSMETLSAIHRHTAAPSLSHGMDQIPLQMILDQRGQPLEPPQSLFMVKDDMPSIIEGNMLASAHHRGASTSSLVLPQQQHQQQESLHHSSHQQFNTMASQSRLHEATSVLLEDSSGRRHSLPHHILNETDRNALPGDAPSGSLHQFHVPPRSHSKHHAPPSASLSQQAMCGLQGDAHQTTHDMPTLMHVQAENHQAACTNAQSISLQTKSETGDRAREPLHTESYQGETPDKQKSNLEENGNNTHDKGPQLSLETSVLPEAAIAVRPTSNGQNDSESAVALSQTTPDKKRKRTSSSSKPQKREKKEVRGVGSPSTSGGRKDPQWIRMYKRMKEYREEHGDCIVPRGYPPSPSLSSWVAEQR